MPSLWKPAMLSVLIGMLAFAPASEAHTLKMARANKANATFAKLVCKSVEGDAACTASRPGRCHRLSQHRARCVFFLTLSFDDGSASRCRSLIEWSLRDETPRLSPNYLGVRSCVVLREPDAEEPAH